jgi:6,7-dimethyl-8-ribityllumazine synthase
MKKTSAKVALIAAEFNAALIEVMLRAAHD